MKRFLALVLLAATALAPAAWTPSAAQSSQAKAERRDPIFLRFPEMAERYWVTTGHLRGEPQGGGGSDAAPMRLPLCRFLYQRADERERSAADGALELQPQARELGPLGENYSTDCRCQVVVSNERYVVPRSLLPDDSYGPVSIFYRDDRGNVARVNGVAKYGALIGRDRSVTFSVENQRGEQVCEGTFSNNAPASGLFSLSASPASSAATAAIRADGRAQRPHHCARATGRGLPV